MHSGFSELVGRYFGWFRRRWFLSSVLLSGLLLSGLLPYLVFAVTFTKPTTAFLGNVGIGITSPSLRFHLNDVSAAPASSGNATGNMLITGGGTYATVFGTVDSGGTQYSWIQGQYRDSAGSTKPLVLQPVGGNVLIGTTSTFDNVSFALTQIYSATNAAIATEVDSTAAASQVSFFNPNGRVGFIATNGSATTYNTSSDRRVKENIATTTLGLDTLMRLPVRDFHFVNDPTHATTTGFIAQELNQVFAAAVTTNGDNGEVPLAPTSTPWSVDYGRITPLIVKAVQDIANITGVFRANLIAWLGSAENGIVDLFAKNIYAKNITAEHGSFTTLSASSTLTDELCVSRSDGAPVCVTGDELSSLLSGSMLGASTQAAAGATSLGGTEAPSGSSAAPISADAASTTTAPLGEPANDNAPAASEAAGVPAEEAPATPAETAPGDAGSAESAASSTPAADPSSTATDNSPANDNPPPLAPTGTDAASTP